MTTLLLGSLFYPSNISFNLPSTCSSHLNAKQQTGPEKSEKNEKKKTLKYSKLDSNFSREHRKNPKRIIVITRQKISLSLANVVAGNDLN